MKILKDKKGLTIIELLATIIILCLIVGITVMIILTIVRKVKDNSYKVTLNEVEKDASVYVLENKDRLLYITIKEEPTLEYQCVTVQNLIDKGYLDNNAIGSQISDDKKVEAENYIYIERNKLTKAITQQFYITDTVDQKYKDRCKNMTYGEITFTSVPPLEEWSRSKDITITYKVFNIIDVNKVPYITYTYTYDGQYDDGGEPDNSTTQTLTAKSNGKVIARMNYDGDVIQEAELEITKIDRKGPTVTVTNDKEQIVRKTVTIPLLVTDEGSGVKDGTFTKEAITIKVGDTVVTDFTLNTEDNINYDLTINESKKSGTVTIIIKKDEIYDKVDNPNSEIVLETKTVFDNSWKITYNTQGGTNCNPGYKNIPNGEKYGTLCVTKKDGNTFEGWWTAATGGSKVTEETIANESRTIYAHWKEKVYDITYDTQGGTACNPSSKSVKHNNKYGTLCTTTKKGYIFRGWFTAKTGGSKVGENTVATESRTIYAQWTPKKLTIKFDCNTGAGGGSRTYTYDVPNQSFPNPALCSKEGHDGTKWTWEKAGTTGNYGWTSGVSNDWIDSNSTGDTTKTLYAQWKIQQFTITYDGNGATGGSTANTTCDYNVSCNLRNNGYTKEFHVFDDWWSAPTGGTKYTGSVKLTSNITVYAHWKEKLIKVTFDTQGGSSCNPSFKELKYGEQYGTLCNTSKGNELFVGWFTEKTGGKKITSTTTLTNRQDHTLYAHWFSEEVFTKGCQEVIIPATGNYRIQAWGGAGGKVTSHNQNNGGYTAGNIRFNENDKLVVCAGGAGKVASSSKSTYTIGGFNGGGAALAGAGTGGGASDIRYFGTGNTDKTWNSATGLNNRIMVAAGGGGDSSFAGTVYFGGGSTSGLIKGGAAGGLNGTNGGNYTGYGGGSSGTNNSYGIGASQYKGGQPKVYTIYGGGGGSVTYDVTDSYEYIWGGKGYGGDGVATAYIGGGTYGSGGGGSGYYGGSAGSPGNILCDYWNGCVYGGPGGGGGGSSYISGYSGCANHSSGKTFTNMTMTANSNNGAGKVIITYLGS